MDLLEKSYQRLVPQLNSNDKWVSVIQPVDLCTVHHACLLHHDNADSVKDKSVQSKPLSSCLSLKQAHYGRLNSIDSSQ